MAVSEEDKANEGRAAVSWGSAEDGKEDHTQPLASGLTWAGLVPPTPDARGRAGPSAQTSTAKGRALLITRLPCLLGAAGPAFLTRLGTSSIVYDPATLPGQHP